LTTKKFEECEGDASESLRDVAQRKSSFLFVMPAKAGIRELRRANAREQVQWTCESSERRELERAAWHRARWRNGFPFIRWRYELAGMTGSYGFPLEFILAAALRADRGTGMTMLFVSL
jgi:hypothetical protein